MENEEFYLPCFIGHVVRFKCHDITIIIIRAHSSSLSDLCANMGKFHHCFVTFLLLQVAFWKTSDPNTSCVLWTSRDRDSK